MIDRTARPVAFDPNQDPKNLRLASGSRVQLEHDGAPHPARPGVAQGHGALFLTIGEGPRAARIEITPAEALQLAEHLEDMAGYVREARGDVPVDQRSAYATDQGLAPDNDPRRVSQP